MGAAKSNCDIFIVPAENYEEALKTKRENDYNITILKAENFKQVLEDLEKLVIKD